MTALFAGLLVRPPFLWSFDTLGYDFAGQVATAVAVPFLCGYLSDWMTKVLGKRNGGVTEVCVGRMRALLVTNVAQPEYRLIAVIIPLIGIFVSTILFGKTAQSPSNWSWAGIAVTINFEYFGFVGIVGRCLGPHVLPARFHRLWYLIWSRQLCREAGYEGAFNICAGIVATLMGLGVVLYLLGGRIRAMTQKWACDE